MIARTAVSLALLLQATPTPTVPADWWATSTAYWATAEAHATGMVVTAVAADTLEAQAWASQAARARGTAWGWPGSSGTPTLEPTPTLRPSVTPSPAPYTASGPTPTLPPRPTATWFAVTPRPTSTRMAREELIATWTAAAATAEAALTAAATSTPTLTATAPSTRRAPAPLWLPLALAPHSRQGVRP